MQQAISIDILNEWSISCRWSQVIPIQGGVKPPLALNLTLLRPVGYVAPRYFPQFKGRMPNCLYSLCSDLSLRICGFKIRIVGA